MKIKLVALIGGAFLLNACDSSSGKDTSIPAPVQAFEKALMDSNECIKENNAIVFVLNPSECGSCEREVVRLIKKNFSGIKKWIVLPYKTEIDSSFRNSKIIRFQRRNLAEWGVLNANGSVLVIENSECVFYKPIDIQRIDALIGEIRTHSH